MQYPISVTPEIRTCFDFVFVYDDDFIPNRKRIYEYYFGIIPQFKIFNKIIFKRGMLFMNILAFIYILYNL